MSEELYTKLNDRLGGRVKKVSEKDDVVVSVLLET